MTSAELKTYRETLGLPREWLANKAGVNARTVSYWEAGNHPVPDDVAALVLEAYSLIQSAADEAIKQVNAIAVRNGIPEQINLLRYRTDADLHCYRPDFVGFPAATHAAMLAIICRELRLMGIRCVIVYFDADKYQAWLNGRMDNESLRAAWAASQER
jgi:DNA-binding XRE family transcriptional regulator